MNNSQFLKPTIIPPPPPPPIRTLFESFRLILPTDADSPEKAGMIWLRKKRSSGGIITVPEYITHAVVYPIASYVEKDTKGNWQHSTLWRVHPAGRADYSDIRFSDGIVFSNTAARRFAAHGAHVVESRHFSRFAEFLRCQLIHFKETAQMIKIT